MISGPNPQVTDSNGNIQFIATDLALETVTYTAVDVTDGNLAIPGCVTVDFTGSPSNTCGSGLPPAAPGFVVTPYATGFSAQPIYDRRRRRHQFRLPGSGRYCVRRFGESLRQRVPHREHLQVPARRRRRGTQHAAQQHLAGRDAGRSGVRFERRFVRQPGLDLRRRNYRRGDADRSLQRHGDKNDLLAD